MQHSDFHGAWCRGYTRQRSIPLSCEPVVLQLLPRRTGSLASFAPNSRPSGSAALATSSTLVSISTALTEPALTNTVFAIFNLVFLPVVYFLYPETANRTLEDRKHFRIGHAANTYRLVLTCLLVDDYFDRDSPHKTIIPINDKVAKQHKRPLEAIEAERRRVEAATEAEATYYKGSNKQFVEHVEEAD